MPPTLILVLCASFALTYAMGRRRSPSEFLVGGVVGCGLLIAAAMIAQS